MPVAGRAQVTGSARAASAADAAPLVAHIIFRLDVGGLENGLVNLINGMPPERYRHVIVCLTGWSPAFRERLVRDGVEVHALNKRPGKDPGAYYRLLRLLRRLSPDIVHTRNLGTLDCVVPAALAGVRCRIHGEHGWDMVDLHGTRFRYRLLRRLCRPLITRYVTVSGHLRDWLTTAVGVPERRITHIINGVDALKFRPPGAGLPVEPGVVRQFGSDAVVLGMVGRLQPVKNPALLARAFVALCRGGDEAARTARLAIVGDGPEQSMVREILADAGLMEHCWLPGVRDDIAAILRGLDVFVLPSRNEGISNTVLEAMATGLPVVATDVGGNPELVVPGVTGALVPDDDVAALTATLRAYVNDAPMRRAHGAAGRRRIEDNFSLEVMVGRYLALYDQACGIPDSKVRH